jgi:hypothetical protein
MIRSIPSTIFIWFLFCFPLFLILPWERGQNRYYLKSLSTMVTFYLSNCNNLLNGFSTCLLLTILYSTAKGILEIKLDGVTLLQQPSIDLLCQGNESKIPQSRLRKNLLLDYTSLVFTFTSASLISWSLEKSNYLLFPEMALSFLPSYFHLNRLIQWFPIFIYMRIAWRSCQNIYH